MKQVEDYSQTVGYRFNHLVVHQRSNNDAGRQTRAIGYIDNASHSRRWNYKSYRNTRTAGRRRNVHKRLFSTVREDDEAPEDVDYSLGRCLKIVYS